MLHNPPVHDGCHLTWVDLRMAVRWLCVDHFLVAGVFRKLRCCEETAWHCILLVILKLYHIKLCIECTLQYNGYISLNCLIG